MYVNPNIIQVDKSIGYIYEPVSLTSILKSKMAASLLMFLCIVPINLSWNICIVSWMSLLQSINQLFAMTSYNYILKHLLPGLIKLIEKLS